VTVGRLAIGRPGLGTRSRQVQPVDAALVAGTGVALVVGLLVASTAIGGGDYGQWLMVSRGFNDLATPAYRDLSQVPPLVPWLIALLSRVSGDPVAALHAVAGLLVAAMGGALLLAGWAVGAGSATGLVAVVLGLIVTDQLLELLAFGALPQTAAIVFLTVSVACFAWALRSRASERRWWIAGCGALFLACLSHVATATIALPACILAAGLGFTGHSGEPIRLRLRRAAPLLVGFAAIGAYWAVAIAPASVPYVANPASLAYRGPDRLLEQLFAYPPTAGIIIVGGLSIAGWAARSLLRRRLPPASDPRTVVAVWALTSWAAFAASAIGRAATDYPRFAPLLVVPLVVIAADAIVSGAARLGASLVRRAKPEQGIVALSLAIVLVAPFSIANYQTEANGYRLPDDAALSAAATWADGRLLPGMAILAPVREAKWIEGLTGRSTLFTSMVRYSFRPAEWDRSLAASTLMRGDLGLVNESFIVTLNDGAPTTDGEQPRAFLLSVNHGGDWLDLLRLVPTSSVLLGEDGATLASLPALTPAGVQQTTSTSSAVVTTAWSAKRSGSTIGYAQSVRLDKASTTMGFDVAADTSVGVGGLRAELRPVTGAAITDVAVSDVATGGSAVVTFARVGETEPRVRIEVLGGSVTASDSGGLLLGTSGPDLSVTITDLSAGAASSSLAVLKPIDLLATYGIGAAILRRDPAYEDRRERLELLGFRVAHAEGPYVVMVRAGSAVPASP
jgi:hypothetical protein